MTPQRILFAPDSFKGSIRARLAAQALAAGWRTVRPADELLIAPMADGGEGTLDAFASAHPSAQHMAIDVEGPTGEPVRSSWLYLPQHGDEPSTGVVELASTVGIELLGDAELRPLDASSFGFGQAIRAAIEHGVTRLVLAIGGSASSDGGVGMLEALGARALDERGRPIVRGARGLEHIAELDLAGLLGVPAQGAVVLTDVNSPLLGAQGASRVFGPQKGASEADIGRIEQALGRWAAVFGDDGCELGSGAAGGVGFGLMRWGAVATRGAEAVADLVGLPGHIRDSDLVITGEGAFDAQSAAGKAVSVVSALAQAARVPVALVAGKIEAPTGEFVQALSLSDLAASSIAAREHPGRWLEHAGAALAAAHTRHLG